MAIWKAQFGWAAGLLWAVALLTAFMTAFYMGRVTFKTFLGKPRWTKHFIEKHKHPHESSPAMVMPLIVLASLAILAGFMGMPKWFAPATKHHRALAVGEHRWLGAAELAATAIGETAAGHEGHVGHDGARAPRAGTTAFITLGSVTTTEVLFAALSVLAWR